ncbi:ATPase 6, plasma membrane-type [Acrasis kona]|uniref:ATPase 6, plasma membrane-type n=1 Tax=Acrasis kona TaxID=1008807 RepID=A0AAW2Z223_9EUKA
MKVFFDQVKTGLGGIELLKDIVEKSLFGEKFVEIYKEHRSNWKNLLENWNTTSDAKSYPSGHLAKWAMYKRHSDIASVYGVRAPNNVPFTTEVTEAECNNKL